MDCKKIKPVNPKGNQPWIFIGRTDAEDEAPILWPSNAKSWLIRKDTDAGKDWRQEKKGMTEDEIVGWYYQLNGHEFEQAPGDGEGQGSLACCSPWGHKESDLIEGLNKSYSCLWLLFLCSCIPLLSLRLITETCSKAGIRSQNGLSWNSISYIKKAISGSLCLGTP